MPDRSSITTASSLRSRAGRLCVALQGATVDEILRRAEAALGESAFLEFRLDSLEKPEAGVEPIARFLAEQQARRGELAAIATCRRKEAGGGFAGTLDEEVEILTAAAEAGFSILDLAIESAEALGASRVETLHESWNDAGAAMMVSFHDFRSAADPTAVLERVRRFEPDFLKIVT